MDKKLRKEIKAMLAEERQAGVECCGAWASNFVSKNHLVIGEISRRHCFNKELEKIAISIALVFGIAGFFVFGSLVQDAFVIQLTRAVGGGICGILLGVVFGYFVQTIFQKSTSQSDVEKDLFGEGEDGSN